MIPKAKVMIGVGRDLLGGGQLRENCLQDPCFTHGLDDGCSRAGFHDRKQLIAHPLACDLSQPAGLAGNHLEGRAFDCGLKRGAETKCPQKAERIVVKVAVGNGPHYLALYVSKPATQIKNLIRTLWIPDKTVNGEIPAPNVGLNRATKAACEIEDLSR